MKEYYVYMVRCSDSSYYIGVTNNVFCRVSQHNIGKSPKAYTYKRRPVTLVYSASFIDVYDAIAWEKKIKRWSKKKKEALIEGDTNALRQLSRSQYKKRIDAMVRRAHHDIYGVALNREVFTFV